MTKKNLLVHNIQRRIDLVTMGSVADTFWSRGKGLIGRKELDVGDGLLISPCSSIHCCFMSIPIDVIYLDRDNRVVGLDKELRPWRIGGIYRGAKRVLELPAGTIEKSGTAVGDWLEIAIFPRYQPLTRSRASSEASSSTP
ncbi:MAG: DUF192 domain-containing protein [Caldilineaceae bacterium]|nr:DUF192 domain-containing protein [Caldilineaceae bacterium]